MSDLQFTVASLFTCGGSFECGAELAGFKPIWGIESDRALAELTQLNFGYDPFGDVLTADPYKFERPDLLHINPATDNFNSIRSKIVESKLDLAAAAATCRFIKVLQPTWVTLENTERYRTSVSFTEIYATLLSLGYQVRFETHNAHRFNVAQDRFRFIVRATKNSEATLIDLHNYRSTGPHLGWLSVIEDLIPQLKESQLTAAQTKQMASSAKYGINSATPFMIQRTGYRTRGPMYRWGIEPCWELKPNMCSNSKGGNLNKIIDIKCGSAVRNLSPRAFARLASFPDTYQLPASFGAAKLMRSIASFMPPNQAAALCKSLIESPIATLIYPPT